MQLSKTGPRIVIKTVQYRIAPQADPGRGGYPGEHPGQGPLPPPEKQMSQPVETPADQEQPGGDSGASAGLPEDMAAAEEPE